MHHGESPIAGEESREGPIIGIIACCHAIESANKDVLTACDACFAVAGGSHEVEYSTHLPRA